MSDEALDRAREIAEAEVPLCADLDEDCPGVADYVACYLYDPARGRCPYIISRRSPTNQSPQGDKA